MKKIFFLIIIFAAFCFIFFSINAENKEKANPKQTPKVLILSDKDLPQEETASADKITTSPMRKVSEKPMEDKILEEIKESKTENEPEDKSQDKKSLKDFEDFKLNDLDGRERDTFDLRYNKWTLIKFGASWCPPCKMQTTELLKVVKQYPDDKLKIIEVSMEPFSDAKKYHEKSGATWINLVDDKGDVAKKFGIIYIPTVYIIDPDGKIVFVGNFVTFNNIEKILTENGFDVK